MHNVFTIKAASNKMQEADLVAVAHHFKTMALLGSADWHVVTLFTDLLLDVDVYIHNSCKSVPRSQQFVDLLTSTVAPTIVNQNKTTGTVSVPATLLVVKYDAEVEETLSNLDSNITNLPVCIRVADKVYSVRLGRDHTATPYLSGWLFSYRLIESKGDILN